MKPFLTEDFLLSTPTARSLYHQYAKDLPIVDYHCHVIPREIYEDKHFANITELWLGGDHYKWRLMRSNGVEESCITGDAPAREKFQQFAQTLPKAIGNPMYHWCHLELKNYFGYQGVLNGDTAQEVWDLTRAKLARADMGVRGLLEQSRVAFVGTTDDPVDTLEWHEKIVRDPTIQTVVAPSFRPDRALNLDKEGWRDYMVQLSAASGVEIDGIDTLEQALRLRMEHFAAHGCRASDHGLDSMVFQPASRPEVDGIVKAALAGERVGEVQAAALKTALLLFCAREYARLDWVMQLHYNCLRNPNSAMLAKLGPDSGFDCIGPHNGALALAKFLDVLYAQNTLPRTILYSLDPGDNAFLDTLIGAFQSAGYPGTMQHGSAWWFNDNLQGMRDHLTSLASLSLLGNFVGMLTDSRSFLSYTRHEYFRRILCDLLGGWVEQGQYPADLPTLGTMVQDICCHNAVRYFRLEKDLPFKL